MTKGNFKSVMSVAQARLGNGLRLLILALVIASLQPSPILIIPGPKQVVKTTHPVLGVHTRLTDEVEPWKIQRTLKLVREMGASSIVEFFPWAYYHAEDGGFAWGHPDLVIEHAAAQGLQVIARIGLTPDWARPDDTPLNYLDQESYDDLAFFASEFARRYDETVSHIIIWNEPNLSYEWGYRPTTAQDYVDLLKVVYPAIKAVSPETKVLAGALAPTLEPPGSQWGTSDLTYLKQMYEAGASEYFDGLAVHAYGLTFPPESDPGKEVLNFRRVELIRQIMQDHEDNGTPIFITETGWNDHPRWTLGVKPAQRIRYTLDGIKYAEENWPYVELVAIWAFRYPAPTMSYPDYFTLVTPEFVPKPIYQELQSFTGN